MVPGSTEHEIPLLVGPGAALLLLRLTADRGRGCRRAALVLLDELRLRRHARRGAGGVVVGVIPQKGSGLQCDQMLPLVTRL